MMENAREIIADVLQKIDVCHIPDNYYTGPRDDLSDGTIFMSDRILAALKANGLQIVPVEPSGAMLLAGYDVYKKTARGPLTAAYKAMLAISPTQPKDTEAGGR